MATLISVTNTPPSGAFNFTPASADVKVSGRVTLKSTGSGTISVYTWVGDPSSTNPPQAVFTSGSPPYSATKPEGASYTLKSNLPSGTKVTVSVHPTGVIPPGGGLNGTINVKPA